MSRKEKPAGASEGRLRAEPGAATKRNSVDAEASRGTGAVLDPNLELLTPTRGEPIPLEQREVDNLIRGDIDYRLAQRLASRPMFQVARPRDAVAAVFAPVRVEAEDLEALAATGETPHSVKNALDAAAKTPGRFGDTKPAAASEKASPTLPPEEG